MEKKLLDSEVDGEIKGIKEIYEEDLDWQRDRERHCATEKESHR